MMTELKTKLGLAAGAAFIVLLVVFSFLNSYGSNRLTFPDHHGAFKVERGASLIKISRQLEEQGVIDSAKRFVWYARINGQADNIKVGEYDVDSDMTVEALIDDMAAGKVKQYSLTVVEGWNFKQLIEAIAAHPNIEQTLSSRKPEAIMTALGYDGVHPEGRFLPDTYLFPYGTTDVMFLKRAYKAMENVLEEYWPKRAAGIPLKNPYEALVLASIVEKETGVAHERKLISGVFTRRLQQRMRLQTDPTVIYGMGDRYKGNIRRKDLKTDTPYNTYTRHGLPPTPIALPGRDAIEAALHPADGEQLYFVAKGDGSHYFSATVEEHNKAVRKYQIRNRKKDYRSTPEKS